MQDLNDLYYFAQVVEHGGFAPASRALGLPKSKLSRRIALLEERLGVRLIQRSTRHFSVTDIGQDYYAHCRAMLLEADAAQAAIEQTRSEPSGVLRVTCPIALLHARVGTMLTEFMAACPKIELHLEATNRRVDVIAEGIDIALRARPAPLDSSDLMLKVLGERGHALVASRAFLERHGPIDVPTDLTTRPTLDLGPARQEHIWMLEAIDGARAEVRHHPRLVTDDMLTLRNAALAGTGIAQLPLLMVSDDIRAGTLLHVLPSWAPRRHIVHAVYASKRGLRPSVRALLDHLGERFAQLRED
ncbi:MAG TPA: LysR family transcriptional regulator [Povalibacter sp.]|uniref:LysR family transcriptional regulator n=1 Tax=Povalibacter sp. TaxID=1962978 RepID=UPI002C557137|nr:LysR family transcriptional regulator [Povalibacter sp.]HMN45415.1 LysR family transcriptional regulator [Povalibacter sp.]